MKKKKGTPLDPRLITDETIARACDACVALWIKWMREPEDWMLEHLKTRNVAEWVSSAAENAWVMHDNCDANTVVQLAMHESRLLEGDDPDEIPEDEGEAAYNDAIWTAVAHQSVIDLTLLHGFLRKRHRMNSMETEQFMAVLVGAPKDGLEQACKRALPGMHEPIRPDKVSPVSDAEATMVMMWELPKDERRAREAAKRIGFDWDDLQNLAD